jgi:outer membrane immunogenic protein
MPPLRWRASDRLPPATAKPRPDGWQAGIEAALGGGWTGKVENLYMGLGSVSGTFMSATTFPLRGTFVATSRVTDEIMRVGVNYRFGGPTAKY